MEDSPQNPTHAQLPAKRPDHRFALYDPKTNLTRMPFIVTKHEHGEIVSAIARPTLQLSQGHLAALPMGDYDTVYKQKMPVWIATADGFRYANTVAGWSISFPPQVHVPGVGIAPNPYIEVDRDSGAFVKGFARAIGIGRSALTADLMIVDRPTHISVQSYIEEDFAMKAKYHPTAIVWGTRAMNPMHAVKAAVDRRNKELMADHDSQKTPGWQKKKIIAEMAEHEQAIEYVEEEFANKQWEFRPISRAEMGRASKHDIGLWINLGTRVVTDILTNLVGKRKFGARLLGAVAERNVLRTALGFYRAPEGVVKEIWPLADREDGTFSQRPKIQDAFWSPPVTVHRMNFTPEELNDIRSRYLAGMEGGVLRQAHIDVEVEENSGDNLMIVEPVSDDPDDYGVTRSHESVIIEGPEDEGDRERDLSERERLIIDANKFEHMIGFEVADELRKVCFSEPVFVDMQSEPIEDVRKFVSLLKRQVANISSKEVSDIEPAITDEAMKELLDREASGDE